MPTRGQEIASQINTLFRARNPIIWIVSSEEARVERHVIEAAAAANYVPRMWDVAQGATDLAGKILTNVGGPDAAVRDPGVMLNAIMERATFDQNAPACPKCNLRHYGACPERTVWIMRDLPAWLTGPGGTTTLRQLRNLARTLPGVPPPAAQALVILSPSSDVPPELANHVTLIEFPLPDRAEIASILDAALLALPPELQATAAPNGTREAAIDAAIGLSGEEAAACYASCLVSLRRIDPVQIAQEKRRVISKEKILQFCDALPGGMSAVGGLGNIKSWLMSRVVAYTKEARAYGVVAPRGILALGVQGCGKSLIVKAFAAALGVPLVLFDLNAFKSKFVGESEANLRRAFRVLNALGRVVVWIDEIEKALQGATSASSDGGVSADALGALLTWMQDRQGESFVFATANDVSSLPPELLRKGRFDEIFFVDLPTQPERESILAASLRARGRGNVTIDLARVAGACNGFIGSEIAELVPDSLFAAFADGAREITTEDLLVSASNVTPLSKTASEKIDKMRQWAAGRARPATAPQDAATATAQAPLRLLDIS